MAKNIKFLLIILLLAIPLAATLWAAGPELIGIVSLSSGDQKSGVFQITGLIVDDSSISQVAVKIGNGPWEVATGIANWSYILNSRQIVLASKYKYDSSLGKLVWTYERGVYYGDLNITVGAFDASGKKVAEKTVVVKIIPDAPYSDLSSGTYDSPINVTLKAASEVSIYYTTDGSDPQINGSLYTGPIPVAQDTTIKAVSKSNTNLFSTAYTLDLKITNGIAQPIYNIQYYQDQNLTQPLPEPPYLTTGTYYLKIVTNKKLITGPFLTINAQGTLNNVTQTPVVAFGDCVYRYTRVINNDNAATGTQQETIQLSGTDVNGNQFLNINPVNSITKAAYIVTQPPAAGSIALEGGGSTTNDPTPYFTINSNGASQMRLALSEAGLAVAPWVNFAVRYDGFDISRGGNGTKMIWIEFKDKAGNIQTQHAHTTVSYSNSALSFDIGYYSDAALTQPLGANPILEIGTYYLKITANQDLTSNPTVNINAEGTNSDVTNGATIKVTSRIYYYAQTIRSDIVGAVKEIISINGITPSNADTGSAYIITPQYNLTFTNDGNGSTSPSGVRTVDSGANTNISAIPNTGYCFVNWTQTGGAGTAAFGDANLASTTVTLTGGNATIQANFAIDQYTLTLSTNGYGYVTPGKVTVNHGESTSIIAIPKTGYRFVNWTQYDGTGTAVFGDSNLASTTVAVTGGNVRILAHFSVDPNLQYNLTVTNDSNGDTSPSGTVTVTNGTGTSITATPYSGYLFRYWTKTAGTGTVTFGNDTAANTTVTVIGGNATIKANFVPYTKAVAGGSSHSLSLKNDGTVWSWGLNYFGQLGNGSTTDSSTPVQVNNLSEVSTIAAGSYHSLAIKNDGTVRAWGADYYGQLGNGSNTHSNIPVQVSGLSGVIAIAGGGYHSLAVRNDGTVWSWGRNNYGQLGNGSATDNNIPVQISSLSGIITIAGGDSHSLALKNDGTVWTWGYNYYGQLGNGSTTNSNIPVQVSGLSGVIAIAAGNYHSLALKNDGTVWAWGSGVVGALGNGSFTNSNIPVQVSGLSGVIAIAGGGLHNLAIKNDSTVWAWGSGVVGELGNGSFTNSNIPVQVSGLSGAVAIAGGFEHSLALKNDGMVWTWGNNNNGELGNGSLIGLNSNVPIQPVGPTSPVTPYLYGLTTTSNENGSAIPPGTTVVMNGTSKTITAVPNPGYSFSNWTQVDGTGTVVFGDANSGNTTVTLTGGNATIRANFSINTGIQYTLTVTNDGNGSTTPAGAVTINNGVGMSITAIPNNAGYHFVNWTKNTGTGTVIFDNATATNTTVTVIGGDATIKANFIPLVKAIAAGYDHSMALKSDGTAWAWGDNHYGQLGNGSNTVSYIPVQVSRLSGVIAIAGGYGYSMALKNDGTIWAWGDNNHGQLGDGSITSSNIPVQVSGLSGVIAIAAGDHHSLALKNDGTVWAWGNNVHGQLGNGSYNNSDIPVQVSGLNGVIAIAGGGGHCLALKSDGTVWVWGSNYDGELGFGSWTSPYDSKIPVKLSSLSGVIAIAARGRHSLALKNDGTAWAWGDNYYGQLGNGSNTGSHIPVQVSGLSGVIAITGGIFHNMAFKNDGTVWAWGSNGPGLFGNGSNTDSNIPVQINELSGAIAIAVGNNHSLALKNDGTIWTWGNNTHGQLGNGTFSSSNVPVMADGLTPSATPYLFDLTVTNDGNGNAIPSGTTVVITDANTVITAIPNAGYVFSNWTQIAGTGTVVFGDANAANTTVTLTGGNATIRANFSVNPNLQYTLTVTNDGYGSTFPAGAVKVNNGSGTSITATPNNSLQFINWTKTSGTGAVIFEDATAANTTVTVIGGDATIKANFTSPFNTWIPGSISAGETQWLVFLTTIGSQYNIYWNDPSGSDYLRISAYHKDGSTAYFSDYYSTYYFPVTITAVDDYIYIKVEGYAPVSSGTFAVKVTKIN
jgi:alpha-tubulin suppressor-like RCC1 family protein